METRQYLYLLRRWTRILILGFVIGAIIGLMIGMLQPPLYEATTKLLVMRSAQGGDAGLTYLSDKQMVQTYIELLTAQSLLQPVSNELDLVIDPKKQIIVQQIQDAQVIQLQVRDNDPQQAALIANTMVSTLLQQNDILQTNRYAALEESLKLQIEDIKQQIDILQADLDQSTEDENSDQIAKLGKQIAAMQAEIEILQQEIASFPPVLSVEQQAQIDEKQKRMVFLQGLLPGYQKIYSNLVVIGQPFETDLGQQNLRLLQKQTTLEQYQKIYLTLFESLESLRLFRMQNTSNIVQIEAATIPDESIQPPLVLYILLIGVLGLLCALGIAAFLQSQDRTMYTIDDVHTALDLPVLGHIARITHTEKRKNIFVMERPDSPVAEAYRSLLTSLEFASKEAPLKTLMVVSVNPGEGRTSVAVNLAASFALSGKKVVLLDADLRHPALHTYCGVENNPGFGNLLTENLDEQDVTLSINAIQNLKVVPGGPPHPNPLALLRSKRTASMITKLGQRGDIVILDTPALVTAEAQYLASLADGVLWVLRLGKTNRDQIREILALLNLAQARIIGIVLNDIPAQQLPLYGENRFENYLKAANRESVTNDIYSNTPRFVRKLPACPYCQETTRQNKAGKTNTGSQRYHCMHCGRKYTFDLPQAFLTEDVKEAEIDGLFTLVGDKKTESTSSPS